MFSRFATTWGVGVPKGKRTVLPARGPVLKMLSGARSDGGRRMRVAVEEDERVSLEV